MFYFKYEIEWKTEFVKECWEQMGTKLEMTGVVNTPFSETIKELWVSKQNQLILNKCYKKVCRTFTFFSLSSFLLAFSSVSLLPLIFVPFLSFPDRPSASFASTRIAFIFWALSTAFPFFRRLAPQQNI